MVKDILLAAMPHIEIHVRDEHTGFIKRKVKMLDLIYADDMEAFSQLDDSILDVIRMSHLDSPEIAEANRLINRLLTRDLYVMAGNMPVRDEMSLMCKIKHDPDKTDEENAKQEEKVREGKDRFDHEHKIDWSTDDGTWHECRSVVHKHRVMWNAIDDSNEELRRNIVEMFRAQHDFKGEQTHTPPNGEDMVPDSDAEDEVQSSQFALEERERAKESRRREPELLSSDLRLKKFTVHSGGGCKDKFGDPLTKVWFFSNDEEIKEGFESGSRKAHRVDPEHYKVHAPAFFCIREIKVALSDLLSVASAGAGPSPILLVVLPAWQDGFARFCLYMARQGASCCVALHQVEGSLATGPLRRSQEAHAGGGSGKQLLHVDEHAKGHKPVLAALCL